MSCRKKKILFHYVAVTFLTTQNIVGLPVSYQREVQTELNVTCHYSCVLVGQNSEGRG
uniref:Uncharacterized protein n=1 Tax=Anguilla anguilla TaxID=7936 RepID=A0A0E9UUG8_ANGAN